MLLKKLSRKKRVWIVIGVIIVIPAVIAIGSVVFEWVLYQRDEYVDINSGRIKEIKYVLSWKVSEKVEDTVLTKALPRQAATDMNPKWRIVNIFPFIIGVRVSTYTRYHGAIHQILTLEKAWRMAPFSPEAKRRVAETVLHLWQLHGNDYDAGDYVMEVFQLAADSQYGRRPSRTITVEDLPHITIEDGETGSKSRKETGAKESGYGREGDLSARGASL